MCSPGLCNIGGRLCQDTNQSCHWPSQWLIELIDVQTLSNMQSHPCILRLQESVFNNQRVSPHASLSCRSMNVAAHVQHMIEPDRGFTTEPQSQPTGRKHGRSSNFGLSMQATPLKVVDMPWCQAARSLPAQCGCARHPGCSALKPKSNIAA